MTHEEWVALTPEEQRIRVAELCGWRKACGGPGMRFHYPGQEYGSWSVTMIPDYLNDLNHMHEAVEAECAKDPYFRLEFAEALMEVVTGLSYNRDDCVENFEDIATATAAQRAEAFVIVMTKE